MMTTTGTRGNEATLSANLGEHQRHVPTDGFTRCREPGDRRYVRWIDSQTLTPAGKHRMGLPSYVNVPSNCVGLGPCKDTSKRPQTPSTRQQYDK